MALDPKSLTIPQLKSLDKGSVERFRADESMVDHLDDHKGRIALLEDAAGTPVVDIEDLSNVDTPSADKQLPEWDLANSKVVWSDSHLYPQLDNFIANAYFNVAQNGTSFVSPTDNDRLLEPWVYDKQFTTADVTVTQNAVEQMVDGDFVAKSIKIDVTTADDPLGSGDVLMISNFIEGYDMARLVGRPFKLRFKHKHTKTGKYAVSFANARGLKTWYYTSEYEQSVSDVWETAEISVAAPDPAAIEFHYGADIGCRVMFPFGAGSNYHTSALDTWIEPSGKLSSSTAVNPLDSTSNNMELANIQICPLGVRLIPQNYAQQLEQVQRRFWKSDTSMGIRALVRYNSTSSLGRVAYIWLPTTQLDVSHVDIGTEVGFNAAVTVEYNNDCVRVYGVANSTGTDTYVTDITVESRL